MTDISILIVEDEAIVAADLANKLRRLGYTVAGTTDRGEEAVAITKERKPNLILMDIRLAGKMDGVEAAERIRKECGTPVIYLTASSERKTIARAKLTEPFGYILKPFEEHDLERYIEMATNRHQAELRLRESVEELRQKSDELERSNKQLSYMNNIMVGRELRMVELKNEVDELCRAFGRPTRYGYGDE